MMSSRRQLFNLNLSKETIECNIAIVGELGVGKSALTVKYLTKRFIMEYDPYLEDTYQKTEYIDGQEVLLRVMDTSDLNARSPERYLKWAQGVAVVYSITNRQSYDKAKQLLQQINQREREANKPIAVILVGNKLDLERYRLVSKEEAKDLATSHGCLFLETSAAEDIHSVELLFQCLGRKILKPNENCSVYLEEKGGLLNPISQGLSGRTFKRTKSPGSGEVNKIHDKEQFSNQRRTPSTFKIFKSRFNIFN